MPTSSFPRSRPVVLGLAGLGLLGALAGCSTAAASPDTGSGSGGSGSGSSAGGGSSSGTSTGTGPYKNGSYTADGGYTAPSGHETITVTLTLADDKVTAVKIGTHATDPNAIQYQTDFADGIAAQVVGKDVDSLGVSRVSGSSLTSQGFRAALEAIKKQAAES